ncbi:MAG TPA: beta-galactosidase [Thermoanaerobaculia bacterium]|nr:beta-galactosidase [Thermoanaerobaculia bacterium]
MKRRCPILVSALLLALIAVVPPAARAAASSPYGINIHAPQGTELTAQLNRVKAAGIGWVRIDFIWAVVQPTAGTWDWHLYDAIAKAASARGIKVYATLAYTPAWATDGPELTGVPRNPEDWVTFCYQAAQRYRKTITTWGLWNEPNLPRFWSGSREDYVDFILRPGATAIHAANSAAKVGGPDLAHVTTGSADWYNWLRLTLLEAGSDLDIITHHVYDSDGNRGVTSKLDTSTVFANRPSLWDVVPPSVREVLKITGWYRVKPFWLTETGWESDRVSEGRQAEYLAGLLGDWFGVNRDWVDKVFFYELKDAPDSSTFGVLSSDGNPKPAYGALRSFARAHPNGN